MADEVLYTILDPATGQRIRVKGSYIVAKQLKYLRWADKVAGTKRYAPAPATLQALNDDVLAVRHSTASNQPLPRGTKNVSIQLVLTRERDPAKLAWSGPLLLDESQPSTLAPYLQADGSVLVKDRFNRSDDPDVPPVRIKTTKPVIFQGGATFAKGQITTGASGAIFCDYGNIHLTVKEHLIHSGHPGKSNYAPARAIYVPYGFRHIHVEGVEAYGTGGFSFIRDNNSTQRIEKLIFKRIYVKNLDGRVADLSQPGGWKRGNLWQGSNVDFLIANILQLIDVRMAWVDFCDISDIEMESLAGESRFEDAWAFQRSGGSPTVEMLLQRIKMRGCYVYDEAYNGTQAYYGNNGPVGTGTSPDGNTAIDETGRYKDVRGKAHSGGMGLFGDGVWTNTPIDQISQNIRFKQVYALDFANYGVAIQSGINSTMEDFVSARSGFVHNLKDGRTVKIPTKHLPIQLEYGPRFAEANPQTYVPPRSLWGGHTIKNARYGQKWFSPYNGSITNEGQGTDGNPYQISPSCVENGVTKPAFTFSNNTYLADVTPTMVDGFWKELDSYWNQNRIAIGLADRIPVA